MKNKNLNRKLAEKHGAKILPFNKLPKEARYAIIHYMVIDGEAWEVSDELMESFEKGWKIKGKDRYDKARELHKKALMLPSSMKFYSDKYGHIKFGYGHIPTKELIEAIWKRDYGVKDWGEDRGTFEEYKEWYFGGGSEASNHPRTHRWPSILGSSDDCVLEDGWNRFHSYVDSKCRTIPCVFYVAEEKYF